MSWRCLLFLCITTSCFAATNSWIAYGPSEGFRFSPIYESADTRIVYGASFGQFYKSVNGGKSWRHAGFAGLDQIIDDPLHSNVIYALGRGLLKSTDRGNSWVLLTRKLSNFGVNAAAVDFLHPNVIYASADPNSSPYISLNEGFTWKKIAKGLPQKPNVTQIVLDPSNSSIVYLMADGGPYRSDDGGQLWHPANIGLPDAGGNLRISPRGEPFLISGGTLFHSIDRAKTWKKLFDFQYPRFVEVAPSNPEILYVEDFSGFWKSEDGGKSFRQVNTTSDCPIEQLAVDPKNPDRLIVSACEIFRSENSGETWINSSYGVLDTDVKAVHATPTTVFAGAEYSGLYRSKIGGTKWIRNNELPRTIFHFFCFVNHPFSPEIIFACGEDRVLKTSDGGKTWSQSSPLKELSLVKSIAISYLDPNTMYAATEDGVYKSTDGGQSWQKKSFSSSFGFATFVAVDPNNPSVVYSSTARALFKSTDGGDTWTQLSVVFGPATYVISIHPDPANSQSLLLATTTRIFRSIDAGSTWTLLSNILQERFASFTINPSDPSILFAGTVWQGVFRSTDSGKSWTRLPLIGLRTSGSRGDASIQALAYEPFTQRLFAGTAGGVYQYTFSPTSKTSLTGIRPALVRNETTITLSGQNLGTSQGTSKLFLENQNLGKATKWNSSEIEVPLPSNVDTGHIYTVINGKKTNAIELLKEPRIYDGGKLSISPDHGPKAGGTLVSIKAVSFSNSIYLYFGDSLAKNVRIGPPIGIKLIFASSPPNAAGDVSVLDSSTPIAIFRYDP